MVVSLTTSLSRSGSEPCWHCLTYTSKWLSFRTPHLYSSAFLSSLLTYVSLTSAESGHFEVTTCIVNNPQNLARLWRYRVQSCACWRWSRYLFFGSWLSHVSLCLVVLSFVFLFVFRVQQCEFSVEFDFAHYQTSNIKYQVSIQKSEAYCLSLISSTCRQSLEVATCQLAPTNEELLVVSCLLLVCCTISNIKHQARTKKQYRLSYRSCVTSHQLRIDTDKQGDDR